MEGHDWHSRDQQGINQLKQSGLMVREIDQGHEWHLRDQRGINWFKHSRLMVREIDQV